MFTTQTWTVGLARFSNKEGVMNTNKSGMVLLVEDDPDIRESLIELIDAEGFGVHAVSNGQEALAVLARQRPCLIIADYVMPDMNGGDLAKAVKGHESLRDIPFVLLTAATSRMTGPMNIPVLPKPVSIQALLAVLRHHCPQQAAA
jgi:CheY-like chemotaxis protein